MKRRFSHKKVYNPLNINFMHRKSAFNNPDSRKETNH